MKLLFTTLALLLMAGAVYSFETPEQEEKMVALILMMDDGEDDDQELVATIYTTLMAAEKVAKVLDIEMIAQDEVSDDVFVFSLKSEKQRELTMQMLDEEGYTVAASRVLRIEDGNNYNALNVKSLPDGTYKFILSNKEGAEQSKTITIKRDNE